MTLPDFDRILHMPINLNNERSVARFKKEFLEKPLSSLLVLGYYNESAIIPALQLIGADTANFSHTIYPDTVRNILRVREEYYYPNKSTYVRGNKKSTLTIVAQKNNPDTYFTATFNHLGSDPCAGWLFIRMGEAAERKYLESLTS